MKFRVLPLLCASWAGALCGAEAGGWEGGRARMAERGVEFSARYFSEVFGNVTGGGSRGLVFDGLLFVALDADLEKLTGLPGARIHADFYQTHGASGSGKHVGDLGYLSNIDYYDGYRLGDLWFEQGFFEERFSIRVGQMSLDAEFMVCSAAGLFINASFGPANALVLNAPTPFSGFSALGALLRYRPSQRFYAQVAVYDGNPAPGVSRDFSRDAAGSDEFNHFGTHWALRDDEGALLIAEVGVQFHQPEGDAAAGAVRGLAGSYKAGAFYHTDTFSNVLDGTMIATGASMAPAAVRSVRGNYGFYAVAEQELWREEGSGTDGLGFFARAVVVPGGRNAVDFSAEAGLVYQGIFQPDGADALGIAFAWINVSDSVRNAVRNANRVDRFGLIEPDYEAIVELTYRWQLAPWWTIQPDVQWILHPGGSGAIGDAFVIGVRSVFVF